MKKLLLAFCIAFASATSTFAQVIDFTFENNWSANILGGMNPQGWLSANNANDTTLVADNVIWHWGSKSARITTKNIPGVSSNTDGLIPDTSGLMLTGVVQLFPAAGIFSGLPCTTRHDSLGYFIRYAPNNNDTGFVMVVMTKFNYNNTWKRDTIGIGITKFNGSINDFTLKYTLINYGNTPAGVNPDTCSIVVSSSSVVAPKIGSTLWIDDLKWGTINTGIYNIAKSNSAAVYPNPAASNLYVNVQEYPTAKTIEIYNAAGIIAQTFAIESAVDRLNLASVSNGYYSYQIKDKNNAVLKAGKLVINR